MALVTTPGSPTADSYASLTDTDAYFLARGTATWTGSDAAKEAALRKATTYLDNQYRGRWKGIATTQTQALAWPRIDGYRTLLRSWTYPLLDPEGFQIADTAVPAQIKNATMEAALLALGGAVLEPTLVRGGQIKSLSEQVGPLATSTVWTDGAPAVDRYLVIEGILRGLVTSTPGSISGNTKLVRA